LDVSDFRNQLQSGQSDWGFEKSIRWLGWN